MAAVLFVITIPTQEEETRLKKEFIARKLDIRADRVEFATTQPSTIITVAEEVNAETASTTTTTIDIQTTPTQQQQQQQQQHQHQYGTFPKRRKSDAAFSTECLRGAGEMGASDNVGGGSLKDIDVQVPLKDGAPIIRKSWEGLRDILSSSKRKSQKKRETYNTLNLASDTCMEIVLREILRKFKILNAIWTKDSEGSMHQIIFTIEFNENYENILDKFHEWGIGDRERSTISVMNVLWSKTFQSKEELELPNDELNRENLNAQKQGAWDRFMNSVRSRLNVAQIVRDVSQDASITFDFVILLISAAILASFGLVEDSTIFLASSMLISPLMGPIIAGIFGTVIKDRSLRSLGLRNELFGILIATFVGFLFGMIVGTTDERYGIGEGLTKEMLARCDLHSLLVGVFTAIPSGAAAAIGILGGNIGSLVGVAISASLLPPAVNSGLLWALACIYKFFETDESRYPNVVKSNLYSNNQATELAILGSISMCLTIANVLCIYILGILVLKVKEIAPVISRNNRQFWKHDIKIARDLKKNGFDTDAVIIDEFANLAKEDQKVLGINCEFLRNMQLDETLYQNTWSPIGSRHPVELTYEPMRENYSTVHHIDRLYSTITRPQERRHKFSLSRRPTGRASDMGTNFKLPDNIPRCSTMPSKVAGLNMHVDETAGTESMTSASHQTSGTTTPTGIIDKRKRRKFIVTPAEDPLLSAANPDEMDA